MEDIRKRDTALIKDILMKKTTKVNDENTKEYLLYFKDYYDRTGKTIKVNRTTYSKAFKDNEYYIVFKKDYNELPIIYKKGTDRVDRETLNSRIDISYLGYYLDDEDLVLTQDKTQKFLDKEDLKRDILKDEANTLKSLFLMILVFPLFILFMGILSLNLNLILISISLFILSFIIIIIFNYKKIKISLMIQSNSFKIQKDTVENINKSLDFRSTYHLKTLTFKKIKKEIRVPKREFLEIQKGDDVYLILSKNKEIIRCYNAKYTRFDKDLGEYINE